MCPRIAGIVLSEPSLTYTKAVEIAQATETAAQSLRELRNKPEEGRASPFFIRTRHRRQPSRKLRLLSFVTAVVVSVTLSRSVGWTGRLSVITVGSRVISSELARARKRPSRESLWARGSQSR